IDPSSYSLMTFSHPPNAIINVSSTPISTSFRPSVGKRTHGKSWGILATNEADYVNGIGSHRQNPPPYSYTPSSQQSPPAYLTQLRLPQLFSRSVVRSVFHRIDTASTTPPI
ncbi:4377_t:CDS:2, partial [Paraglomus brasilianum]